MSISKILTLVPSYRKLQERNRLYQLALEGISKSAAMDFSSSSTGWEWCSYTADAALDEGKSTLANKLNELAQLKNEYGEPGMKLPKLEVFSQKGRTA